jgi:hypothetical protein
MAHAVTITDPVPGPVYLNVDVEPKKSYSFEHDIMDYGFLPGLHSVLSATVDITFTDDALVCCTDRSENVNVTIGATTYSYVDIDYDDLFNIVLDSTALDYLDANGKLPVLVTATRGDLYFVGSQLTAQALMPTPPDLQSTPEPATWMLLGSGLAGIVGFGMKRRKQENCA